MYDKQTIILFSRMGLSHLFGGIDRFLKDQYNIIHIAYSDIEKSILEEDYQITPKYTLVQEIELLSNDFDHKDLLDLDDCFESNSLFNLNSAIISDRTLESFSLKQAYTISVKYYLFWKKIFKIEKPDFIFHETTTHMYNHIACILSKKNHSIYSGFIATTGIYDFNFRFTEFDDGDSLLLKDYINKNINIFNSNTNDFINKTRNKESIIVKEQKNNTLLSDLFTICKSIIINFRNIQRLKNINKLTNPNEYFIVEENKQFHQSINRFKYSLSIKWDKTNFDESFYFFPLHIEPEAVLSYWSAGKFSQIDIIEQIARQLPVNTYLYVKDHKLEFGYRSVYDYTRLKKIPNVRLLTPSEDSIELIKHCEGVIVINGTVGFEANIFNKPVYLLGNIYYKHDKNIINVKQVEDLKFLFQEKRIFSNNTLKNFVSGYLNTNYQGDIRKYFLAYKKCEYDKENLKIVSKSFRSYIESMKELSIED